MFLQTREIILLLKNAVNTYTIILTRPFEVWLLWYNLHFLPIPESYWKCCMLEECSCKWWLRFYNTVTHTRMDLPGWDIHRVYCCSLPPFISCMPSWRLTTYICPKHAPGLGSWRESLKATDNEIQDNELDEAFGLWRSVSSAYSLGYALTLN